MKPTVNIQLTGKSIGVFFLIVLLGILAVGLVWLVWGMTYAVLCGLIGILTIKGILDLFR